MKRCYMCTAAHDETGNFCVTCDQSINYKQEDESSKPSVGQVINIGGAPGGISLQIANGLSEDTAIEMLEEAIRTIKAFK